jgi:hypothetical protein
MTTTTERRIAKAHDTYTHAGDWYRHVAHRTKAGHVVTIESSVQGHTTGREILVKGAHSAEDAYNAVCAQIAGVVYAPGYSYRTLKSGFTVR